MMENRHSDRCRARLRARSCATRQTHFLVPTADFVADMRDLTSHRPNQSHAINESCYTRLINFSEKTRIGSEGTCSRMRLAAAFPIS